MSQPTAVNVTSTDTYVKPYALPLLFTRLILVLWLVWNKQRAGGPNLNSQWSKILSGQTSLAWA
eukprot:3628135-Karenia_brevis.AAC.1